MFHDRLEELVAHEDIISILTKLIDSENLPHLLFYGPPGTGKVSEEKNNSRPEHIYNDSNSNYIYLAFAFIPNQTHMPVTDICRNHGGTHNEQSQEVAD